MESDGLERYYGTQCQKCGNEPRVFGGKWGTNCLTASQRWHERNAQEVFLEEYRHVPYDRRHPPTTPPPSPFRPMGACPRCGASQWVDRSEGQWGCASCGTNPQDPTMRKPV